MIRYIAVDRHAAEEIIADRFLQSIEYENGRSLASILKRRVKSAKYSSRVEHFAMPNGIFFATSNVDYKSIMIFDLENSFIFSEYYSDSEVVLHFQKVLRFATRHWGNHKYSPAERLVANSTKVAIFPHPISQRTALRLAIELNPDSKRLNRRAAESRYLLAYRIATDEGGGPAEEVRLNVFRSFLEDLSELKQKEIQSVAPSEKITTMAVTSLEERLPGRLDAYQGFDRWQMFITDKQRSFIESELNTPHRIEGPAGSGKTLSLILKALTHLRKAEVAGEEHRALFIVHSEATRRTVEQLIHSNDPGNYNSCDTLFKMQSLKLSTLQKLCGEILKREISESEFLDRDAMESKQLQLLYVSEALTHIVKHELHTYQRFLSPEFIAFVSNLNDWAVAELMQHEISVVIKGRAGEYLDNYKKFPRLKYGAPIITDGDRGFAWMIYKKYQNLLQTAAQFDTDDIVLTAIGQLGTPLWRRRRQREGYNSIFIDETHLFNMNELSIFHYLCRSEEIFPIVYSVDRSQAIGDRGWTSNSVEEALAGEGQPIARTSKTEVQGIFRCSPDIVNLAFSVTSSGATLFTNFEDPLRLASSMFTESEERKCELPSYHTSASDQDMVQDAYLLAERLTKDMGSMRSDTAIIAFSQNLFEFCVNFAEVNNKAVEVLRERGDIEVLQRARQSGRFVLSTPDYVGGLEFDAVILIGVDDGRVPPARGVDTMDSLNFLNYASHNRLYVSITRARYRVVILGTVERGESALLKPAIKSGVLRIVSGS